MKNIVLLTLICTLTFVFSCSRRKSYNLSAKDGKTLITDTSMQAGQSKDYLSPDLRARVEKLKKDVLREPTTPHLAKERARLLWDWSNAFASQGGHFSIDVPLVCGVVLSNPGSSEFRLETSGMIDRFIREIQIREEQPDAIGTLSTNATGPFQAESYQTIEHTYTVGEMPMVPGGGTLVTWEVHADIGQPLQSDDQKADNYVTVRCTNPDAKFIVASTPFGGTHGNFFVPAPRLTFRLEGTKLKKGDKIILTYGDQNGGSRGLRIQSKAVDNFPLPVYVDLEGRGQFFSLPVIGYPVTGKEVVRVRGIAPSVVKTGELFRLSVRSEDIYYNRAGGLIPEYEVEVNGKQVARVEAGSQSLSVLQNLKFDKPGVYRFTIRSADGKITALSNPVRVKENPEYRIYWGDTHGHTELADAQGTPDGYWQFGRDDASLDFLVHSEHDMWMDDSEWELLKSNVKKYSEEGKFIGYLGYEWTMKAENGGHHNVIFRTPDNRKRVPVQEASILSELYQSLASENDTKDVLIIPHAHEPGDYRFSHPQMEHLVELASIHGRFEYLGRQYLNHGHQVGFIASSDDHMAHPGLSSWPYEHGGLAAVLAPQKTTDAIFDAMRARSTYAVTPGSDRIIVDFKLNTALMGQRISLPEKCTINCQIFGTAPIDVITLIKNGNEIHAERFMEAAVSDFVEVSFGSCSDPVIFDSPRGGRIWKGVIKVNNASLVSIQTPSLRSSVLEWAQVDSTQRNQINFNTFTKGFEKAIILELKGGGKNTTIDLGLDESREAFSTTPSLVIPERFPAESFSLAIKDIGTDRAQHKINAGKFAGKVSLRFINPDSPFDQLFQYVDTTPDYGDYYYVHVKQINGAEAWSSPVWTGGFSSK